MGEMERDFEGIPGGVMFNDLTKGQSEPENGKGATIAVWVEGRQNWKAVRYGPLQVARLRKETIETTEFERMAAQNINRRIGELKGKDEGSSWKYGRDDFKTIGAAVMLYNSSLKEQYEQLEKKDNETNTNKKQKIQRFTPVRIPVFWKMEVLKEEKCERGFSLETRTVVRRLYGNKDLADQRILRATKFKEGQWKKWKNGTLKIDETSDAETRSWSKSPEPEASNNEENGGQARPSEADRMEGVESSTNIPDKCTELEEFLAIWKGWRSQKYPHQLRRLTEFRETATDPRLPTKEAMIAKMEEYQDAKPSLRFDTVSVWLEHYVNGDGGDGGDDVPT